MTSIRKNFGYALRLIEEGGKVRRKGWDEHSEGSCVKLIDESEELLGGKKYIGILNMRKKYVFWSPTHEDLLADDWEEVKD